MSETKDSSTTAVTATPSSATPPSAKWLGAIGPLTEELEMSPEEVTKIILDAKLVNKASDKGAKTIADANSVTDADFARAFPDVASGTLRAGVNAMREAANPKPVTAPASAAPAASGVPMAGAYSVLAQIPDAGRSVLDGLNMVSIGKVDGKVVVGGIRVALAARAGLYRAPEILLGLMDAYVSTRMEEAAPSAYYELEDEVAKEEYAPVLRIMNVSSRFVNKESRLEFLAKVGGLMQPLRDFHVQLTNWYDGYQKVFSNPAAMVGALAGAMHGGQMGMMPGMQAPDTTGLHDGAQLVTRAINKAFAGKSIPAAMALAYQAERINEFLRKPEIVTYTGCTNREELARVLADKLEGSAVVTPEYSRLENSLVQYALSVYEIEKLAPVGSPNELNFLSQLFMLGNSINWDKLTMGPPNHGKSNGGGRREPESRSPVPTPGQSRDRG